MKVQTSSTEIAENIYRLTVAPNPRFEFSSFLILDKKPCLVHAGKLSLFEPVKKMLNEHLNGKSLSYVIFSHVEGDESGAVNKWLETFEDSKLVCNKLSNMSLGDSLKRPAQIMKDGDSLDLGHAKLQMIETPHFPHNWDAHMWLETQNKILFSSDFCCQGEVCTPISDEDMSDKIISFYDKVGFIPYGKTTNENLEKLSAYDFNIIAPMHGSVLSGDSVRKVFEKVKTDLIKRA